MSEIDCIMRQTTYTREEATESLERNKTIEGVIREYLGIVKKEAEPITVNQGIFKSIRDFIDKVDETFF
jgi:hypothetical protein